MNVKRMVLGGLANNTYLLVGEDQTSCVIVDPAGEAKRIVDYLEGKELDLKAVLVTHGHYDHIAGLPELLKSKDVPVYAHKDEQRIMKDPIKNLSTYFMSASVSAQATDLIGDMDLLDFGSDLQLKSICVPGHSPKSLCYYHEGSDVLFSGDTLFAGSIGRVDLYDGPESDLIDNIKAKLLVLPDTTKVMPGHGETSTIGKEKDYNPYLK